MVYVSNYKPSFPHPAGSYGYALGAYIMTLESVLVDEICKPSTNTQNLRFLVYHMFMGKRESRVINLKV